MFTVLVPFYNGHTHIERLLESIPDNIPVVIIDDVSDVPLSGVSHPQARVVRLDQKGYFTGAINAGLQEVTNDVLILNQDTYFTGSGWLDLIERKRIEYDLIGEGVIRHLAWPKGYIHGTFMYIRRDVIEAVGSMDAENYPLWGSTCEYQLRACRKGFKALPLSVIPDFVHKRKKGYGDSIRHLLKNDSRRGLFIRTPPMISVVINCYNHGRFLEDAINSLVGGPTSLGQMPGQTFQSFEIIIVDDGSTDSTPKIGQRLANSWQGIRYIRQENYGSAVAMNTGIQRAYGKYIAPLDADDMMEPGRLERMFQLVEANSHSCIYDDVAYFGHGRRGIQTRKGWTLTLPLPREYDFDKILRKNGLHKGLLYPKRAWEEAGGYPPLMDKGREDWAFNVALGLKGYCGLHTGAGEYLYRREGHNRTITNTTPKWRQYFMSQLMELYPSIYEGERPMGCCGGGRRTNPPSKKAKISMNSLPGKDGMVILEYNGKNSGDETWVGPVTKQIYVLGGVTRRGYVDKEDAGQRSNQTSDGKGMLALREGNRYLFNLYVSPPVEILKTKPPDEIGIRIVPSDYSVSGLKGILPDLTTQELEQIYLAEKAGKSRSTALEAIDRTMHERVV